MNKDPFSNIDLETSHFNPTISRRAAIRTLGATLTLPFLPSLAWAQAKKGDVTPGIDIAPRRWATVLFANGVNVDHWWAKGEGDAMQLSSTLQPLEPFKKDLLFLDNLHLFDDTVGVHTPYFTNFLSGEEIRKGAIPSVAQSLDQLLARTVGKLTPVSSLTLGTEPGGPGNNLNSTISWASATTPVPPEVFPRMAFDRLFDVSGLLRDRSILDFAKEQAADVRRKLGRDDRENLEEYLSAIRDIEQRIDLATAEDRFEGWRPSIETPNVERPPAGRPQNVREHMKLMVDIIVLAFQMDQTRVATLLFQKDITSMSFKFLQGVSNTGMHTISHHRHLENMLTEYQKINLYHVEMFAYMLGKMKAVQEGNGSLLDNTMLLFGSTMRDGDFHDANDLPLVVAGGKNCGIRTGGRHIRYEKLEDRRLCNLHLAMAQRMGVKDEKGNVISKFGNSHYPLPGLA